MYHKYNPRAYQKCKMDTLRNFTAYNDWNKVKYPFSETAVNLQEFCMSVLGCLFFR